MIRKKEASSAVYCGPCAPLWFSLGMLAVIAVFAAASAIMGSGSAGISHPRSVQPSWTVMVERLPADGLATP